MRHALIGIVLTVASALGGCTSLQSAGPPFAQAVAGLPPLPAGDTRIFFYRLLQPYEILAPTTVFLNDRPVGVAEMGTTFYRDVTPGTYQVSVFSQGYYPNQFKTVTVTPGQTLYVRIDSLLTWSQITCGSACQLNTFVVTVANPPAAQQEMQNLPLVRG
jgi:hypothetical protein